MLRFDELIIVAVVVDKLPAGCEVNHVGTNIIEEILGMRHEEKNLVPTRKVIFQPNDSFHIQTVMCEENT